MTNEPLSRPIVPPVREGHRRKFSENDKRRIVEEAAQPGANLSAVARRYGIAARVLFRWKQELRRFCRSSLLTAMFMLAGPRPANGSVAL
jgi:transposase-like protein